MISLDQGNEDWINYSKPTVSNLWTYVTDHPDAEQYERIPILCYKADQRLTHYDLWKRVQDQNSLIASELELRLSGKIL